jgi:hypothetical protein
MLEHDGHESIRRPGLSSDIQRAIGQRLRQHYVIEQSLPARRSEGNAVDLALSYGAAWGEETIGTIETQGRRAS